MKVINKTHYQTTDMRAVLSRVAAEEADAPLRKKMKVVIEYRRASPGDRRCSGDANQFAARMRVFVGRHGVDPINFASVAAHEMAHLCGQSDAALRGSTRYTYGPGWRTFYAWAEAMPIRARAVPEKKRPQPVDRLVHIEQMYRAALTRVKRSQTIAKKWERRLKAARRRLQPLPAADGRMVG